MTRWYGSLQNRLMEQGKDAEEITVGMGVTEFFWSDRHAYEVTQVIDQKHIAIRELKHIHVGDGCMDNNWELVSDEARPEIPLVKRGKYWYTTATLTKEEMDEIYATNNVDMMLWMCHAGFDKDVINKNGKQTKYHRRNIVVGYAEYYFDYEF